MRLTRQEMSIQFPNQWIGINNIQYADAEKKRIESADVIFTDKDASELGMLALQGVDVQPLYTTPDNVFQLGILGG